MKIPNFLIGTILIFLTIFLQIPFEINQKKVFVILKTIEIEKENINKAFFLSTARVFSTGGISTTIRTQPNIIFLGQFKKLFSELQDIIFAKMGIILKLKT